MVDQTVCYDLIKEEKFNCFIELICNGLNVSVINHYKQRSLRDLWKCTFSMSMNSLVSKSVSELVRGIVTKTFCFFLPQATTFFDFALSITATKHSR